MSNHTGSFVRLWWVATGSLLLAWPLGAQPEPPLIPRPARVSIQPGVLQLGSHLTVACATAEPALLGVAVDLEAAVRADLARPVARTKRPAQATFRLSMSKAIQGAEAYRLEITPRQIQLQAAAPAGLFYGLQTLRQLLFQARGTGALPCLVIQDRPRFPWRGMHLDVSRHFFPVPFIKRYLDVLARHKLNVFHWHLTDDHGWRLEIKRHPRLTAFGAWREPRTGNDWLYAPKRSMELAKRTYGGFYTQDDVREVLRYAAARHIRVIPEIEMPAHSMAALDAYPELSCSGRPFEPPTEITPANEFTDPYCAGNEAVFSFLEEVLTEVMALFPDRDIHLGADEARKTSWQACAKCQGRMRELGLKNEEELQGWFMKRMAGFVTRHGKRPIGWDEMAQGGLPPGSLMMHWRSWLGDSAVVVAARNGHEVVRTSIDALYFRPPQALNPRESQGSPLPEYLHRVFRYQPIPAALTPVEAQRVVGVEGCIWTEDVATEADAMQTLLPSLAPLAEVAWSGPGTTAPADFMRRLRPHLRYLAASGVEHAPLPEEPSRGR